MGETITDKMIFGGKLGQILKSEDFNIKDRVNITNILNELDTFVPHTLSNQGFTVLHTFKDLTNVAHGST